MSFTRNVSLIQARDGSILSYNRPQPRQLVYDETSKEKTLEESENIQAYLRIKDGHGLANLYEINDNKLIAIVPQGSNFLRNIREGDSLKKFFTFSKIFPPTSTQKDIFDNIVRPRILEFINGNNSTLMTYGASGSGKTFTVIGTDEQPGIVPRSLEYLFRTLPKLSNYPHAKPSTTGEVTYLSENERKFERLRCRNLLHASNNSMDRSHHCEIYTKMQQRLSSEPVACLEEFDSHVSIDVWVSFIEIYNEQIYDLLQADPPLGHERPKLKLCQSNGQAFVKNVTNLCVTSGMQAYQILQFGIHNLNYAATSLNSHSSRSHSIFSIKLVQTGESKRRCLSVFNFCDLAGSERSKKTHNVGKRLKESNNINTSLLVLGRCISAVRESQKQSDNKVIPFRESKLTQLFQKALSGSEDISMIINISPTLEMFDESQHVLNFAAIVKEIKIDHKIEQPNRFSMLVNQKNDSDLDTREYQNAIEHLQNELEEQRNDMEVNHTIDMNELRTVYEKLLQDRDEQCKREVAKTEEILKFRYESKIKVLTQRVMMLEDQLQPKVSNEIIELDSDDESDLESDQESHQEDALTLANETIQIGVESFRELRKEYDRIEIEVVELRERCSELSMENQALHEQRSFLGTQDDSESSSEEDAFIHQPKSLMLSSAIDNFDNQLHESNLLFLNDNYKESDSETGILGENGSCLVSQLGESTFTAK